MLLRRGNEINNLWYGIMSIEGKNMDKSELLQKIKALADNGIGGEKQNAEAMLKNLMNKYGITEEQLSSLEISKHDIRWKNKTEKDLMSQVFYSIVGDEDGKCFYKYTYLKNEGCIECSSSEFIEFKAKFNFYNYHYKKELQTFYAAFVQANKIFPPEHKIKPREKPKSKLTELERAYLKAYSHDFEWVARDENGLLYAHKNKPNKTNDCWGAVYKIYDIPNYLFDFIKWEDGEPYKIKDLLGEKE